MATGTRWTSVRLEQKLSALVAEAASGTIEVEYKAAAERVAKPIEEKIRQSGRGGEHNADFANQETRVFRSAAGRYNVLLGWLNPPAHASERGNGGKLWYQYQDAGFHLFGGQRWIDGVGATIDRRENLIDAIADVNRRYVHDLARKLER
jgi:hypothetical protein